jgi:hypothetical protein
VRHKQGRHARFIHADANAVAGYARLGHFEYCITDTVSIADADLVIGKTFNGEVFAELAKTEVVAPKKALPVVIGIHLVDEDGALLSTMTREIRLPIAINIELAYHPPSVDWKFPDRRSDSFALPLHFTWETDIY